MLKEMVEPHAEGVDGGKGMGSKTVTKNLTKKNNKIKVNCLDSLVLCSGVGNISIQTHNVSCPVASAEYAGYMPKRFEFETEWDNEAEYLIADLVFHDDDDEELTGKRLL